MNKRREKSVKEIEFTELESFNEEFTSEFSMTITTFFF